MNKRIFIFLLSISFLGQLMATPNEDLLQAAFANDVRGVGQALFARGVDVNARAGGHTALLWASREGYADIVGLLLKGRGYRALVQAQREIPGIWLEGRLEEPGDVDLNAQDDYGDTALKWAKRQGHQAIVGMLQDEVLYRAIEQDDVQAVGQAIAEGAYVNGNTPREMSSFARSNNSFLALAIRHGNPAIVDLLIKSGADVNAQQYKPSPLGLAIEAGRVDIARLLIERGADVNARYSNYGDTALMIAAGMGDVDAVGLLVRNGADVNATRFYNVMRIGSRFRVSIGDFRTALQFAVSSGHSEVVRLLIENHADIDARHPFCDTALTEGSERGNMDGVSALLQAAAQPAD